MLFEKLPVTPCETINMLGVDVLVKRDDLNHTVVQGNKLRKLKYTLQAAYEQNAQTLVTFGGAYSNHLLATAFAAQACGMQSLGFVRGEELENKQSVWSSTLNQCHQYGMHLQFLNRSEYRLKEAAPTVQQVLQHWPKYCLIPEGGSNQQAVLGMADLVSELAQQIPEPSHIICPVGTGGSYAGLLHGVARQSWSSQVLGVVVLKGQDQMPQQIDHLLGDLKRTSHAQLLHQFAAGGYAKCTPEQISFALGFEQQTGIALDKIYNTKSFYALASLIKNQQITQTDRPLIIHTGGLQGGRFGRGDEA